jgi:hypothetical protein
MVKAFNAPFQRLDQRFRPLPVGSRLMTARYTHLSAAWSLGKCPRARTALRIRAFTDSMALVSGMKERRYSLVPRSSPSPSVG